MLTTATIAQPAIAIVGNRRRSATSTTSQPVISPPASPPRWPPREIPRKLTENSRLNSSTMPRPLCQIEMPRARATTISAPKMPKIAPEAPTVGASGWNRSAPNDPNSNEAT